MAMPTPVAGAERGRTQRCVWVAGARRVPTLLRCGDDGVYCGRVDDNDDGRGWMGLWKGDAPAEPCLEPVHDNSETSLESRYDKPNPAGPLLACSARGALAAWAARCAAAAAGAEAAGTAWAPAAPRSDDALLYTALMCRTMTRRKACRPAPSRSAADNSRPPSTHTTRSYTVERSRRLGARNTAPRGRRLSATRMRAAHRGFGRVRHLTWASTPNCEHFLKNL